MDHSVLRKHLRAILVRAYRYRTKEEFVHRKELRIQSVVLTHAIYLRRFKLLFTLVFFRFRN